MEWLIVGLVVVTYLALALWRMEQRIAALEGLTGNAIQRAVGKWVDSMSPRGQYVFALVVLSGAFLGMAAAIGLVLAAVPFFLYLGGTLSLKWLVIIFLGATGLYIAISFGAVFYYHVIRGTGVPWEESFMSPQDSPSTSQGNS